MPRRLILAAGLVLLSGLSAPAAFADDPPGRKPYDTYCSACHGPAGKDGVAPAIGGASYLSAHDDAAIFQLTANGLAAKGMPAFAKSKGGALTDDQIQQIVDYLRAPTATQAAAPPAAPSTAGQVFVQTKLALTQATTIHGEAVLHAALTEYDGYPVSNATIAFSRATSFGTLDLGTVKTDQAGIATLVLGDAPLEAREVRAIFTGKEHWEASQTTLSLTRLLASAQGDINPRGVGLSLDAPFLPPEGSLITPNPPLGPSMLFVLIVGGVWMTYAYVAYQALGIWRRRVKPPQANVLNSNTTRAFRSENT